MNPLPSHIPGKISCGKEGRKGRVEGRREVIEETKQEGRRRKENKEERRTKEKEGKIL
jgi:hypothetical protein